jgi:hypothetical protein
VIGLYFLKLQNGYISNVLTTKKVFEARHQLILATKETEIRRIGGSWFEARLSK